MRITVAVADDHPVVRESIAFGLGRDPAIEIVGMAQDGAGAIALAQRLTPDVMTLDLVMPGLAGVEVLAGIRADSPQTRVIVLTASERITDLRDAIAAGAAGYLSKSATSEALRQAVLTVHGGGSAITPALAGLVYQHYQAALDGDALPIMGERGLQVLRLVAQGKTDVEIGGEMFISPRTVQGHLTRLRQQTGVRRRMELTRWAFDHELV